jgi:hypothetical protein
MRAQAKRVLDALAAKDQGRLTPEGVVSAARPVRSPLHNYFTWDDKVAGARHRLDEARQLIRSFEIVVTTTQYVVHAPAFLRDPRAIPRQGYISIGRLASDAELCRETVLMEFGLALAALRRAKAVAAAVHLTEEIERLHWEVQQLSSQAQRPQPDA